ncbi:hypothetical protein ACIBSV_46710 [Embleya sp. NPDC050154]|uniref:hypothetical protein n=1 Tax=Embleya sp. NPDC050154 TaxID=3363988 RepID=UPI0037A4A32D
MIGSGPELAVALSSAMRVDVVVEWSPDWTTWYPLRALSGTTTQDRTQSSRWRLSGDFVADTPVGLDGIHALGCRLRSWLEVASLRRSPVRIPYGAYYVTKATPGRESISVEGLSYESKVVASKFAKPRTVPDKAGWSRQVQLERLVTEAVPDARFRWETPGGAMCPQATVDEDRWQLVDGTSDKVSLLDGLGAALHCDSVGLFVVAEVPAISADAVVWSFHQWDVVATARTLSAADVRNLIVAVGNPQGTGGASAATIGPVYVYDREPTSLTYAGPDPVNRPELAGRFGVIPERISSPLLDTEVAAIAAAEVRLRNSLGIPTSLEFDAKLQPGIEAGDVVSVDVDGRPELHLIDRIAWKWGSPTMNANTRVQSISSRYGLVR